MTLDTRTLYGFSPTLPPFVGKSAAEQVRIVQEWGCTVVFGGHSDAEFVDAAHEAGLEVYAEYGCFVGARWWQEVPASRPVTDQGAPIEPEEGYHGVNPTVPEVREDRWAALEVLLAERQIDGVWLDFIRWPCHWEVHHPTLLRTSFDPGTLQRLGRDTGIDLPLEDAPAAAQAIDTRCQQEWIGWRCDQITSWVARAREIVDRVRPGALLGMFGVPWRQGDFGGAIREVVGQDYRALSAYVDVFSPMVYHRMCGQSVDWIADVTQEIHQVTERPVWPIVQSVDMPDPLPAEEYAAALDAVLRSPHADGLLVFTMKGALAPEKLAVTRDRFLS